MSRPAPRPAALRPAWLILGLLAALGSAACRFDGAATGALPGGNLPAEIGTAPTTPLPAGRDMAASLRAWAEFCADGGAACDAAPAAMTLTPSALAVLEGVQRRVNAAHPYRPEPLGADSWRTLARGEPGDCEDLALTKRDRLIDLGFPAGALRPATCRLRGTPFAPGAGHAVLTVETDRGTYVLGVDGGVVPWRASECDSWGYRWAGATWVSLDG